MQIPNPGDGSTCRNGGSACAGIGGQHGQESTGIAPYLTKGSLVECAGRIGVNAWTGKEGEAKATLTFHVNNIKLHGKPNSGGTTPAPVIPIVSAPVTAVADDLPF